jgi:hypothetical protein
MNSNEMASMEIVPSYKPGDNHDLTLFGENQDSVIALQAGAVLKNAAIDGDEALKAVEMEDGETIVIDEKNDGRLLRKIGI